MRLAALILGILGALAGFGGAIFAMTVGGLGATFGGEGAETVIGLGVAGLLISLVAVIAAALAMAKPKGAGIVMILSGIAGFIAISMGYIIAGPLLIVAGTLAILGRKEVIKPGSSAGETALGPKA